MNNDDNLSDQNTTAATELEARIVASLLGEASAFETAELDRLLELQPELKIFKRRIEAVSGLVGSAVRPEQAPMRLAPERRAKLLQTLGGVVQVETAPAIEPKNPVVLKFAQARQNRRRKFIWTSALAASLTFAAILTMNFGPGIEREELEKRAEMVNLPSSFSAEIDAESDRIEPSPNSFADEIRDKARGGALAASIEEQNGAKRYMAERNTGVSLPQAPSRPAQIPLDKVGAVASKKKADAPSENSGRAIGIIGDFLVQETEQSPLGRARAYEVYRQAKKEADIGHLDTNLRDQGSAITVVTDQFLKDTRATKASEVLNFGSVDGYAKFEAPSSAALPVEAKPGEDKAASEAPVVLSPFDVTARGFGGYMASTTLSGSRGRSNIGGLSRLAKNQPSTDIFSFDSDDDFLGDAKEVAEAGAAASYIGKSMGTPAAMIDAQLSQENRIVPAAPKQLEAEIVSHEISAAKEPVSTFSLHVSDVSFRLAQAALARGETPDPTRIRQEEFYNAFDYGDPAPSTGDKIGSRIEQSAHPFLQQRNLVRIAMKVASTGRGAAQPLHLTVLLDTSGSMERADRIASVRRALEVLTSLLTTNDRVTLIGFARQPRLLAEALSGDQAAQIVGLASQTPFTGGTNLEEALKLSGELAQRHHAPSAQNRIVLITDGAANLGNADPAQLAASIEALRQQGIAFDACGVGTDGLDDSVLEALTRKGDGRYYVLDSAEDADAGFARQLAGAFRPAAENVKVQVRFNPARVGSYRLIGFEKHRLREEDFRNDQVDAAELAADEAAVALYQVEVLPEGEGDLGEVFVRFRDPASRDTVERSWPMLHEPRARAFDRASPSLQLAGTAAALAEKLQGGEWGDVVDLDELVPVVNTLRGQYAQQARVQELISMFEQMRRRAAR